MGSNRDHDYSEFIEKYENFSPPENRYLGAWLWGGAYPLGNGQYSWIEFGGCAESDDAYFCFYVGYDFWDDQETFPQLEFDYGEYDNYNETWGNFASHQYGDWESGFLENDLFSVGYSACDCDENVVEEICGECGGDGIADGECDCDGNVFDECEGRTGG